MYSYTKIRQMFENRIRGRALDLENLQTRAYINIQK